MKERHLALDDVCCTAQWSEALSTALLWLHHLLYSGVSHATRNKCYCTCVLPGSTVDGWMHDYCLGGASILDLLWYISRVQILRKNLRKWERAELEFVMRARALYKLEALGCTDSHFFAGNHILLTSWENLSKHKMSICTFGNAPVCLTIDRKGGNLGFIPY